MEHEGNIYFSGVGGQGILLASEITAYSLLTAGFDVKKSEVHGMAQRGGSVSAELRYGSKVYSPLIEQGTADVLVAFEMMEAARSLPYLHRGSRAIVNSQKILPPSVAMGKAEYPEDIVDRLRDYEVAVVEIDALQVARELGEVKVVNMVLVGALSVFLPLDAEACKTVIRQRVPERFLDVNLDAFAAGRAATL